MFRTRIEILLMTICRFMLNSIEFRGQWELHDVYVYVTILLKLVAIPIAHLIFLSIRYFTSTLYMSISVSEYVRPTTSLMNHILAILLV